MKEGRVGGEGISLKETMTMHSKKNMVRHLPFLDSDCSMRAKWRLHKEYVEHQRERTLSLHSQGWAIKLFLKELHSIWYQKSGADMRSVVQKTISRLRLKPALRSVPQNSVQRRKVTKKTNPQLLNLPANRVVGLVYHSAIVEGKTPGHFSENFKDKKK